jgi:exopolysaccharide biosynthesis polyprenyl glycosylphosphotransferase
MSIIGRPTRDGNVTPFAMRESRLPPARTGAERISAVTGPEIPRAFFVLLDVLALAFAFNAAYLLAPVIKAWAPEAGWIPEAWLRMVSPEVGDFRPLGEVMWVLFVMEGAALLTLQALGGYRPLLHQSRTQLIMSTMLAPLVGIGAVTLMLFTLRSPSWSRIFIFLFAILGAANLCAYRLILRWYRGRRVKAGAYAKHILLIAPASSREWLASYLSHTTSRHEYMLDGYLALHPESAPRDPRPETAVPLPRLGTVDDLGALLVHRPIHEVIAVEGSDSGQWLKAVMAHCDYFRVTLRIVPEVLLSGGLHELELTYRSDPLRLPEVVLRPPNLDSESLFIKRLIDIVVSGAALVLLSPLFALIAVIIKLTTPRLSVFYRWEVVGFQGKPFTGYKFSTMVSDADSRKEDLQSRNEMQGPVFKIKNDPRITPVGRFLRKFSLNELPQLWSVLKGDMSLVGPRPAFAHELKRYELWHKRKLCVRPGMTCLWQVRGRNKISSFDDWVRMDLEYIDNWSLWLDLKILARTVYAVVAGTGS